jgi:hypothetical protein
LLLNSAYRNFSLIIINNHLMLKEIFDLVRGNARETVIDNPDVPNEYNDEVVAEATNTVASGMRNMVAGGGLGSLLSLFKGGGSGKKGLLQNPIVNMMMGHFASKLMNKFNMNNRSANNLSGNLIPNVLSSLINKTNDPGDSSFSLDKLIGSITGRKEQVATSGRGGIGDLVSQFTGGGNGSSGGNGMLDIIKQFAGGAQEQQKKNGNLMDLIKGFM